tara:strand:- start:756 stop:950 length:195 start_codon:yes stop_codon:yes gene_type:complete
MSDLLEQIQKLVDSGQGVVQKIYMGSSKFETWFIYTGTEPIQIGDQLIETDEMVDLSYWDWYYE